MKKSALIHIGQIQRTVHDHFSVYSLGTKSSYHGLTHSL